MTSMILQPQVFQFFKKPMTTLIGILALQLCLQTKAFIVLPNLFNFVKQRWFECIC